MSQQHKIAATMLSQSEKIRNTKYNFFLALDESDYMMRHNYLININVLYFANIRYKHNCDNNIYKKRKHVQISICSKFVTVYIYFVNYLQLNSCTFSRALSTINYPQTSFDHNFENETGKNCTSTFIHDRCVKRNLKKIRYEQK